MEEIDEFPTPVPKIELPAMPMVVEEADAEDEEVDMAREMAIFEEELLGTLEQDDDADEMDFLEEAISAAPAISPVQERVPMSLTAFAGGGVDFGDDDEYSSSDESDDE